MSLQKFRADWLFDGYTMRDRGHVLIIGAEGIVEAIVPVEDAGEGIREYSGILSPAFINCHCHLELSHMRGLIPEETGLISFVQQVMQHRHFPEEEIVTAIETAETEMLNKGIIAVGDICNNTLTIPQKEKGRLWYHNFIEVSGFVPALAGSRFEKAEELFRAFARQYSLPVASNSIVPHAPYSVSDVLWQKIIHFPGNHILSIHNQETMDENELFQYGTGAFNDLYAALNIDRSFFLPSGKTSLQSFLPHFLRNQSLLLVHNVYTTEEDIEFAEQWGNGPLYWCLCPNANQYITRQLPPVDLFIKQGTKIVLGTDSLASNHQLSILAEMKTIREHFPHIDPAQLFQWATRNGAQALQLEGLLGSFEKGKKPGVVVCEEGLARIQRIV